MTSLRGRRIALIGGAGFIGHNLALSLKEYGAHVEIVDSLQVNNILAVTTDYSSPNRALYMRILNERLELLRAADIPVHIQDARDYHAMSRILNSIAPQAIIQLAAVAHANRSNKDPHSTFDHSLRTLENVLDFARGARERKEGLEHFVYFSSSMVYGNFLSGTVDEEAPCSPLGIYGALKHAGEGIVKAYHQVFGLPYTIIRPSSLYGERCVSRRVGQIFIENAIAGKDITVQGDGSDRLDFTCVHDLVQGVRCVLTRDEAINETFNLTYGAGRSLAEMANILRTEFPQIAVHYEPKDTFTPDRGALSVEKAKRLIGYDPTYPLEQGYVRYIDWYRSLAAGSAAVAVPATQTREPISM